MTSYLENYLSEVPFDVTIEVRRSLESFKRKYLEKFDYTAHTNGLLAGFVQSGKTSEMLGIISIAAEMDFKFFIVLTTDNTRLHRQTVQRAKEQLKGILVCSENDQISFKKNSFSSPTVLVLKKNKRVLETWHRNVSMIEQAGYLPLILLDDEGDAASLNTLINKNEVSTINSFIRSLVNISSSSLYLSVTATPYANLLQVSDSGIRPSFVHIIKPGDSYLGGEFFYFSKETVYSTDENEKDALLNTPSVPEGLRKATLYFIFVCLEFSLKRAIRTCNFLIHPSFKISDHKLVANKTKKFLNELKEESRSDSSFFWYWAEDFFREFSCFTYSIDELKKNLSVIIDRVNVLVVNSTSGDSSYGNGFNIVVGGNSLGRGVTFPKLQVTYYCRSSKIPQADTVWQHSRLFGYDREKDVCRVFLSPSTLHLFREFTESNQAMFQTLATKGVEGISIVSPEGTRPTRKNVIKQSHLISFMGGVNYFSEDIKKNNTENIDTVLGLSNIEKTMPIDDAIKVLELLCDDEESGVVAYISCLVSLEKKGYQYCQTYIRIDRNISRGTGTLLSPDDRRLSQKNPENLKLFMYRLNGRAEHGWDGSPLWIPNIRLPSNICFYSIKK